MLVSSGSNGSAELDSTEVVDLKSGKIFSMAPLGRTTLGVTGGLLDGLPVICGGYRGKQIHSIAKDQSKFLGQLSVRRECAASVVLSFCFLEAESPKKHCFSAAFSVVSTVAPALT